MNNLPQYERDGDWYFHKYEFETGTVVRIMAREVRRERSGGHGALAIERNGKPLAWSTMNFERDEDRTRLVNSAYKHIEKEEVDAQLLTKQALKGMLDAFAFGLFAATLGDISGEMMAGDEEGARPMTILGDDPGLVVDHGSTLLFAPPGGAKSYTGVIMGVSMDAGTDFLWPVQQRRVGYVNLERSAPSMRYRLATVNKAMGLDPKRPLPFLNARGRGLVDVRDGMRRFVEKYELEVLILDSISRSGLGKLNEDSTANAIADLMNAQGCTWIGLAHAPRADDSHVFGSVMFEAAQDVGVKLMTQRANDGMTLGVGLTVTQANDLPTGGLSIFALDFDRERGLIRIRRSKASEFPEIAAGKSMSLPNEIESYLLNLPGGRDAAPDIAAAIGRDRGNVSRVLNQSDRFVMTGKEGRKTLFAVRHNEVE